MRSARLREGNYMTHHRPIVRAIVGVGISRVALYGFAVACLPALLSITLAAFPRALPNANLPLPSVTVSGPISLTTALRDPAHGYPYNATPMDLAKHGYVEEEFFIEGKANAYNTVAGQTATAKDSDHAFKTRMVVRRPKSASKFNGTVIVEWYNVSQGHDGEYDWFQSAEHIIGAGYVWVGVSNQRVGVNALKEWSPTRYRALDVDEGGKIAGDALSFDIFTAVAVAIRGKGSADVLGGLRAARLIAIGHSQSAALLYTYFHSVHPLIPKVYDAVVLHGGGGKVSEDLDVKVFKLLNETDVAGQANNRQPDTDKSRQWEVAGTSHLDAKFSRMLAGVGLRVSGMEPVEGSPAITGSTISGGAGNGLSGAAGTAMCKNPPFSRVPGYYVLNAVLDHTARWVKDGTPPPTAIHIELRQLPPAQAAALPGPPTSTPGAIGGGVRGPQGPRWEVVHDESGNAHGGIELSQHAVPTATNTGQNEGGTSAGEGNCNLMGSYLAWDQARLAAIYPTHTAYVAKVKEVTEKNLKAGYILKEDAEATVAEAERASVGTARAGKP
jgi:Alpha/beta hydrolase domain